MPKIKVLFSGVAMLARMIAAIGSSCWGFTIIASGQIITGAILLASGLLCVLMFFYEMGEWSRKTNALGTGRLRIPRL